jgi:hypothetical protein
VKLIAANGSAAQLTTEPLSEDALRGEDFREPFGGYPVRVNDIAHQTAILSVRQP